MSSQNCVDNDEINKCTKILKRKEQHTEREINSTVNIDVQTEITTEQKDIENYKNEKKIQANSIKQKKQKKYMQKIKQYRNMKVCVVKMKQQLKNKKHKSSRSQTIETEYKMI